MTTTDWLPISHVTHDGPTAAMRLDIALAGLPRTSGEIASVLNLARVKGNPHRIDEAPAEVYLSAKVGARVRCTGVSIEITHDDWRYEMRCPSWLQDFTRDCWEGLYPLIEGEPSIGTVECIDIFSGRST